MLELSAMNTKAAIIKMLQLAVVLETKEKNTVSKKKKNRRDKEKQNGEFRTENSETKI